eukprot:scaffold425_cov373-Pinguiococcus_pyrenoidosus.AAC.1
MSTKDPADVFRRRLETSTRAPNVVSSTSMSPLSPRIELRSRLKAGPNGLRPGLSFSTLSSSICFPVAGPAARTSSTSSQSEVPEMASTWVGESSAKSVMSSVSPDGSLRWLSSSLFAASADSRTPAPLCREDTSVGTAF